MFFFFLCIKVSCKIETKNNKQEILYTTNSTNTSYPANIYMFKVNNRNTRTTLLTPFWRFSFTFAIFYTFSNVSVVGFGQVNVSWVSSFKDIFNFHVCLFILVFKSTTNWVQTTQLLNIANQCHWMLLMFTFIKFACFSVLRVIIDLSMQWSRVSKVFSCPTFEQTTFNKNQ